MYHASLLFFSLIAGTAALSSKCFYLPGISIVGGTYDEMDATDIRQCCIRCASDNCCMGYSFDKNRGRCFMKSAISYTEERLHMTSGIKANTLNGSGSRLKNIQIEGGKSSTPLKNAQECQQYCNSFGIFSWLPPTLGEEMGSCMCTNRIVKMKYLHGAQSAIFPISAELSLE